jgi:cephalosporin hydroxylase
MISISDLIEIAKTCVNEPWGLGLPLLNDTESSCPYYRFLHKLVKTHKPEAVIDCGVYLGIATAHMALGNFETLVIGIDHDLRTRAQVISYYCENIRLVEDWTETAFMQVERLLDGKKVGMLFLDSKHDGITPTTEFNVYKQLFAEECIVVCDDILDPQMESFWQTFPGEKIDLSFLHPAQYPGFVDPGFGASIIRK